ncbi:unnamed protein product [Rotaria magnacalcarata]|uniref:Uncharacterized protein n=1 Tax=Rotaria magnacalcarata TaxID=392030 RepID=A0A8S2QMZ1_9BILA|nr:unnamed protein product [Rotaria magnacalcarata]
MQEDKDSFFTKQFDNWEHFEEQFIIWCNHYHEPVNIKRSSMKYNEKTMKELFDRFRYEHVKKDGGYRAQDIEEILKESHSSHTFSSNSSEHSDEISSDGLITISRFTEIETYLY